MLGRTDQGICLLALVAALSDTYEPQYCGEVIFHLAALLNAPEEFTPSMNEWCRLVQACAGALSAADLGILAGHIIQKCEEAIKTRISETYQQNPDLADYSLDCFVQPDPQKLASTMLAIGDLSTSKLTSISITGGLNIGWLAALAIWLFNLEVSVKEEINGNEIFSSSPSNEHKNPQVRFFLLTSPAQDSCGALVATNRTASLESLGDVVIQSPYPLPPASGRTMWGKCLHSVFGGASTALQCMSHAFGTALGSAAKIFENCALGDWATRNLADLENCDAGFDWHCIYLGHPDTHGNAFVENTLRWFPELDNHKIRLTAAQALCAENVVDRYGQAMEDLENQCSRGYCGDEENSRGGASRNSTSACLLAVFETIVRISWLLARADSIQEGLHPTRNGIRKLYERRVRKRGNHLVQLLACAAIEEDYSSRLLDEAICLFTCMRQHDRNALASTSCGVCVHLDTLQDLTLDSERLFTFHVIAGRIEKSGHIYYGIFEEYSSTPDQGHLPAPEYPIPEAGETLMRHLQIIHSVDGMRAVYHFKYRSIEAPKVNMYDIVQVLEPQLFAWHAMSRVWDMPTHATCRCRVQALPGGSAQLESGDWKANISGRDVYIWEGSSRRQPHEYTLLLARIPEVLYRC